MVLELFQVRPPRLQKSKYLGFAERFNAENAFWLPSL